MAQLLVLAFAVITFARCGFAFNPPIVPLGWTTVSPCVVDVSSRVIANYNWAIYADNTPASCIERCDTANYTYAGVEYGSECFCGTGLAGAPQVAPATDCNMTCAGDPSLSCGGPLLIQIYKSLALAPGTWAPQGCFLDTTLVPTFSTPVITTVAPTANLTDQCVDYCAHIGMPFSGVGSATECQCSLGLAAGAVELSESVCDYASAEALMVFKYQA